MLSCPYSLIFKGFVPENKGIRARIVGLVLGY